MDFGKLCIVNLCAAKYLFALPCFASNFSILCCVGERSETKLWEFIVFRELLNSMLDGSLKLEVSCLNASLVSFFFVPPFSHSKTT